jgi:hypothetical protein
LQAVQEGAGFVLGIEASAVAGALDDPGNPESAAVTLDPVRPLAAHQAIVGSGTDTLWGWKSPPITPITPRRVGGVQ